MQNIATFLASLAGVIVGLVIHSYIHPYLGKKAENLATHEDIDKLVDQVSAVTTTTKQIEAKISDDVWSRQRLWEMKRDVLFTAAKCLGNLDETLLSYNSGLLGSHSWDEIKRTELLLEKGKAWNAALESYNESRTLLAIVCSPETRLAFEEYAVKASKVALAIANHDYAAHGLAHNELIKKVFAAREAVRLEMGVDASVAKASAGTA